MQMHIFVQNDNESALTMPSEARLQNEYRGAEQSMPQNGTWHRPPETETETGAGKRIAMCM